MLSHASFLYAFGLFLLKGIISYYQPDASQFSWRLSVRVDKGSLDGGSLPLPVKAWWDLDWKSINCSLLPFRTLIGKSAPLFLSCQIVSFIGLFAS